MCRQTLLCGVSHANISDCAGAAVTGEASAMHAHSHQCHSRHKKKPDLISVESCETATSWGVVGWSPAASGGSGGLTAGTAAQAECLSFGDTQYYCVSPNVVLALSPGATLLPSHPRLYSGACPCRRHAPCLSQHVRHMPSGEPCADVLTRSSPHSYSCSAQLLQHSPCGHQLTPLCAMRSQQALYHRSLCSRPLVDA